MRGANTMRLKVITSLSALLQWMFHTITAVTLFGVKGNQLRFVVAFLFWYTSSANAQNIVYWPKARRVSYSTNCIGGHSSGLDLKYFQESLNKKFVFSSKWRSCDIRCVHGGQDVALKTKLYSLSCSIKPQRINTDTSGDPRSINRLIPLSKGKKLIYCLEPLHKQWIKNNWFYALIQLI